MVTPTTKRDQFRELQETMRAEENEAMLELASIFNSEDMGVLIANFEAIREKTIPNGSNDNIMTNIITVLNHVKNMCSQISPPQTTEG